MTHDEELVFAALPPAPGRGFADTWWGRGWLQALEDTALENATLLRGRKVARSGAVGAVSVRPGRLTAVVRSGDGTPYRADVLLRRLSGAEWDRLLDTAAREAGHVAALLDHEMPTHLAADAAAAGVDLLPGIGDLEPQCECGEWDHCAHTAALAYQVARLLDADPFVLLLLRGRTEGDLTAELERRNAARATAAPSGPQGEPASEAYARAAVPLPQPPPSETDAPRPPDLGPESAEATGEDGVPGLRDLEFLIADAAARAGRLFAEALRPGHADSAPPPALTVWQDAVRMTAGRPPAPVAARLAEGCGRPGDDLSAAAGAWAYGGGVGLAVLEGEAYGPASEAAARLATAWPDAAGRPLSPAGGGRWSAEGGVVELRFGPDRRWWPFRLRGARWWPAGPPDTAPAAALATALGDEDDGRAADRQARDSNTV
ncbi:SWF or SNF family helicase [Streptomyces avicenniae]|uniref:SWIM zinc finger family protein n=1 Tax=Streptomyces avicenniae TaxID=500153 RepID=UPI0006999EC6|nr:SWF or SNF family helicase [Streptomyces avicenniae]